MLRGTAFLGGAAAFVFSCSSAMGAPDLRPRWSSGNEGRFVVTIESVQSTTPPGADKAEPAVTSRQELHVTRRVVSTDAQGTQLMLQYDRAKVTISVGADSLSVETAEPRERDGDRELGESVRDAVGKPYSIWLDETGRPTKIEGNKFTRGNLPSSRGIAGDEVFRFHLAPLYGLPGLPKNLADDGSWGGSERFLAGHLGTIVTNFTGRVTGMDGDLAKVTLAGKPEIVPAVGPMAIASENLGGAYDGAGTWDTKVGTVRTFNSTRTMKYSVQSAKGKSMVESRLTITVEPGGTAGSSGEKPPAAEPTKP